MHTKLCAKSEVCNFNPFWVSNGHKFTKPLDPGQALTVLELLAFNAQTDLNVQSSEHRQTDRQTDNWTNLYLHRSLYSLGENKYDTN